MKKMVLACSLAIGFVLFSCSKKEEGSSAQNKEPAGGISAPSKKQEPMTEAELKLDSPKLEEAYCSRMLKEKKPSQKLCVYSCEVGIFPPSSAVSICPTTVKEWKADDKQCSFETPEVCPKSPPPKSWNGHECDVPSSIECKTYCISEPTDPLCP